MCCRGLDVYECSGPKSVYGYNCHGIIYSIHIHTYINICLCMYIYTRIKMVLVVLSAYVSVQACCSSAQGLRPLKRPKKLGSTFSCVRKLCIKHNVRCWCIGRKCASGVYVPPDTLVICDATVPFFLYCLMRFSLQTIAGCNQSLTCFCQPVQRPQLLQDFARRVLCVEPLLQRRWHQVANFDYLVGFFHSTRGEDEATTVDSKKLKRGHRLIHAASPPLFGLGWRTAMFRLSGVYFRSLTSFPYGFNDS